MDTAVLRESKSPLIASVNNAYLLDALLETGLFDANHADSSKKTLLHLATLKENLRSVWNLLVHGADPSRQDNKGNTPCHYACQLGNISIMKALMTFDCDLQVQNNLGQKLIHVMAISEKREVREEGVSLLFSMDAPLCVRSMSMSFAPLGFQGHFPGIQGHCCAMHSRMCTSIPLNYRNYVPNLGDGEKQFTQNEEEGCNEGFLLALDGGGVRGLCSLIILRKMEREARKLADDPKLQIASVFANISGTSTGGIIGLCLASGKSVLQTLRLYLNLKDDVFRGTRPYPVYKLEGFLKSVFQNKVMSSIDVSRHRLFIMTTDVKETIPGLVILRNYVTKNVREDLQPDKLEIWRAAKITSSAPTYFLVEDDQLLDGGIVANNSTLAALNELTFLKKSTPENDCNKVFFPKVVVSIGTGVVPKVPLGAKTFNVLSFINPIEFMKGLFRIPKAINTLLENSCNSNGEVVKTAETICYHANSSYFRLSPPLSTDIDMATTDMRVLTDMMWETAQYLHKNKAVIDELVGVLVRK